MYWKSPSTSMTSARLRAMTDDQLVSLGKQMRALTYDGDGKPSVSAFSVQLDEARAGVAATKAKKCQLACNVS